MHAGSTTTRTRVTLAIAPTLEAQVDRDGDSALTVSLHGELDLATADRLCDVLLDLMTERSPHLILDLVGLRFCDPYGLSALVRAANHAERTGGSVTLGRPRALVLKLLGLTGLDQRFQVGTT